MELFQLELLETLYKLESMPFISDTQICNGFTDATVWQQGEDLFGKGWGRCKTPRTMPSYYRPLILMGLGKLSKKGLVEARKATAVRKGVIQPLGWSYWKLSEEGREQCAKLFANPLPQEVF